MDGAKTTNTKNTIRADVIKISWPVLIELLLSSLFGMVDMIDARQNE